MKLKSHDLFSIPVFTGQALTKEQIDDIIEFVENLSESQKYHHGLFGSPDNAETTFWNKENALDMIEAQIPSCVNIKKDLCWQQILSNVWNKNPTLSYISSNSLTLNKIFT